MTGEMDLGKGPIGCPLPTLTACAANLKKGSRAASGPHCCRFNGLILHLKGTQLMEIKAMIGKALFAAVLITFSLPSAAQVLPPPSHSSQDELAEQLVRAIEAKDTTSYASLLSDSVQVFEDGEVVAQNKAEWLAEFGQKLSAEGVVFEVYPGFSSAGRLLFIEYFNSAGSWGGDVPAHCCWSYDAVAYDVTAGKVTSIRRLRGGDVRLNEQGRPPG